MDHQLPNEVFHTGETVLLVDGYQIHGFQDIPSFIKPERGTVVGFVYYNAQPYYHIMLSGNKVKENVYYLYLRRE